MNASSTQGQAQIPDWITQSLHREIELRMAERSPDPKGLLQALEAACQPQLKQPYLLDLYQGMRPQMVQLATASLANSCSLMPEQVELTVYSDYDHDKHMGPRSILRDHLMARYTLQAGGRSVSGKFRFAWDAAVPGKVVSHGSLVRPDWLCDVAWYECKTCTTTRLVGVWLGQAPENVLCLICANNLKHSGSSRPIPVSVEMLMRDPDKYNALHIQTAGWLHHEFEFCALYPEEPDSDAADASGLEDGGLDESEWVRVSYNGFHDMPYLSGWVRLRAVFGSLMNSADPQHGLIPDRSHVGPAGAQLKSIQRGHCPWVQAIRPDSSHIWPSNKRSALSSDGSWRRAHFDLCYTLHLIDWTRTYGRPEELGWKSPGPG